MQIYHLIETRIIAWHIALDEIPRADYTLFFSMMITSIKPSTHKYTTNKFRTIYLIPTSLCTSLDAATKALQKFNVFVRE